MRAEAPGTPTRAGHKKSSARLGSLEPRRRSLLSRRHRITRKKAALSVARAPACTEKRWTPGYDASDCGEQQRARRDSNGQLPRTGRVQREGRRHHCVDNLGRDRRRKVFSVAPSAVANAVGNPRGWHSLEMQWVGGKTENEDVSIAIPTGERDQLDLHFQHGGVIRAVLELIRLMVQTSRTSTRP